jgi:hypothetical protein
MSDNELTKEDMSCLIDALTAWERDEINSAMMNGMILTSLAPSAPSEEIGKALVKSAKERVDNATKAQRGRVERSILIKAKLIQMRDKLTVSDLMKEGEHD